jgi:ParB/RepB/Spo0J family partition protein
MMMTESQRADTFLPFDLPEDGPSASGEKGDMKKGARSQQEISARAKPLLASGQNASGSNFVETREIVVIDPQIITPDPVNVRGEVPFNAIAHADLIASMATLGNTVPIVLRIAPDSSANSGTYRCVSGSRRVGAARYIQIERPEFRINAVVLELTDQEAIKIAEADNEGRTVASPMQTGRHWARQIEQLFGGTLSAFAQAVGKDKSVVSRTVALAELPDWILGLCKEIDALSVNFAAQLTPMLKQEQTVTELRKRADMLAVSGTQLSGPALLTALLSDAYADGSEDMLQEWTSVTGLAHAKLLRTKTGFRIDIGPHRIASAERRALLAVIGKFIA